MNLMIQKNCNFWSVNDPIDSMINDNVLCGIVDYIQPKLGFRFWKEIFFLLRT